MVWNKSDIFLLFTNILVSSANNIGNNKDDTFTMSFTYNKNNSGPAIDPCGTPHDIERCGEWQLFNTTYCFLLKR